jgi:NADH-quinone oxidoreductase subunit I
MLRCIYCGFCVEACPKDAIRMDTGIHPPPGYTREELYYNRNLLMANEQRMDKAGQEKKS